MSKTEELLTGGNTTEKYGVEPRKKLLIQILNTTVYIGTIFINYLNGIENGNKQGAIADQRNITFQPEKWAFSIWGPIFIGLGLFTIW